jgi:hypothetical protein
MKRHKRVANIQNKRIRYESHSLTGPNCFLLLPVLRIRITLMRIRILFFTLMRIRILLVTLMRI